MKKELHHKPDAVRFQSGNVILVSIAHLIHDIYSSFFAPILPLLIEKLGMNYTMVGVLSLVHRLPSLLNPFIGLMADRIALRYLVIITPAITAVSMSLLGLAPNILVLGILLFVTGFSSMLFHVPSPVMIKKLSGDKLGRGMSFYMFGGEMARTIGPLIIVGAVTVWGLEGTWKLIPFGLLATFILYLRFRNVKISEDFQDRKKENGAWESLRIAVPFFIIITGITFFRAITKSALTTFLPTYMNVDLGQSLWIGGGALALLELAGAGGALLFGTISDRIGQKTSLLIIAISSPVLMLLFVHLSSAWSIPILILMGLSLFGSTPIILAMIQNKANDRPAFFNSIFMLISFFISAVLVVGIGAVADRIGLQLTYEICGWLAFGSVPFVLALKPKENRE
ncbi:MAG: MFS transporter [Bacteroidetes bacterium]|nr:MFS transporter [Bacteroidota bacterium]